MRQMRASDTSLSAPAAEAGAGSIAVRRLVSGAWLSVFEVSLAAFAASETGLAREPLVLRIESGRLRLWRIDRARRAEIEAGPGTILRIAAGERFGYANAGETPLSLIVTAATDTGFLTPGRNGTGLAA